TENQQHREFGVESVLSSNRLVGEEAVSSSIDSKNSKSTSSSSKETKTVTSKHGTVDDRDVSGYFYNDQGSSGQREIKHENFNEPNDSTIKTSAKEGASNSTVSLNASLKNGVERSSTNSTESGVNVSRDSRNEVDHEDSDGLTIKTTMGGEPS